MTPEELDTRLSRAEQEIIRLDERLITSQRDRQQLHEDIVASRKASEEEIRGLRECINGAATKVNELSLALERKTAEVTTSVKVLETRVAVYAGVGSLFGGAAVALIVYILEHTLIK